MLGSFDSRTNFEPLSSSFLPVMPWSAARAVPNPSMAMLTAAVSIAIAPWHAVAVAIYSACRSNALSRTHRRGLRGTVEDNSRVHLAEFGRSRYVDAPRRRRTA